MWRRGKYRELIDDDYIEKLTRVSPLHDIGKVGIPDRILLKPGPLTTKEFEIMKTHTTIGAKTLLEVKEKFQDNRLLELGNNITNFHHERWDGTGYPLGLKGAEIPLSARIMAIVDVYDALRSKRVYKDAFSHEKSLAIIKEESVKPLTRRLSRLLEIAGEIERIFASTKSPQPISAERTGADKGWSLSAGWFGLFVFFLAKNLRIGYYLQECITRNA